jgi:purine-binding chemotaxis protein CheW
MSDNEDDDDRMDRAERIRKMREGGGRQSDDDGNDDTGGDSDESKATDESSDDVDDSAMDTPDDSSEDETSTAEDEWVSGADKREESETEDDGESDNEDETVSDSGDEEPDPEDAVPETADIETDDEDTTTPDAEDDIKAPLPDTDQLEEALEDEEMDGEAEAVTPDEVAGGDATSAEALGDEEVYEEDTRVLEFQLGDEYYCLDIEYIEEIVKEDRITRVPNTPQFVEGVVDLRGQITTILNPKVTIGKDDITPGDLIIVFDSDSFEDQGHVGWVVDDVRQVSPITDNEVNDPPVEEDYINGVIDRGDDEQFVIWTSPEMAMEDAES